MHLYTEQALRLHWAVFLSFFKGPSSPCFSSTAARTCLSCCCSFFL